MSLRLFAVGIEFSVGLLLLGWGVASAARPSLWRWRGASWWVDRTHKAVSRVHGLGVGLVGAAIAISAPAPLLRAPATLGGIDAQTLEVVGLAVMVLGAIPLVASHPTPRELPRAQEQAQESDVPELALALEQDDVTGPDPLSLAHAPTPALAAASTT